MLKTCIKHDLRAILRLWWIIGASMLVAGVIAGLSIRFITEIGADNGLFNENPTKLAIFSPFAMIAAGLCIFVLFAGMTLSMILVYWRMYTHFYTDEGYLTFTLPVKRSTLYLSKVMAGSIIDIASIVTLLLSVFIIVILAIPGEGHLIHPKIFSSIGELFLSVGKIGGAWLLLWIPLGLAFLVLIQLSASGLLYLCITMGALIAKKHKLLAGIGIYYLVNTVISFVSQFISLFFMTGAIQVFTVAMFMGAPFQGIVITALLLIGCAVMACVGMSFHFFTLGKLERKLNLA